MRVIAGELGGRMFDSPHSASTHPMGDRIRGALFNTLGDISGLTVLDAFAGSGALSFEAVSRGARRALALELDKTAHATIAHNCRLLGVTSKVRLVRANCSSWSNLNPNERFDIVLCDPPFHDLQPQVIAKMVRHVTPGGLYVVNWPGKTEPPVIEALQIVAHKTYGDAQLIFYRDDS